MNLFDIVGPVMVGPSSSHTAGAVRIGFVAQKLLGEPVKRARIGQKALIAGLLGMVPDDMRIPDSFHLAEEKGIEFSFEEANLKEAHPNSAELELEGISGRSLTVVGESLGGSRINIAKVDGIEANFSGSYPTLVVHNDDQPGHVADVTAMLAHKSINIATMQLYRAARGGMAVMVIECDQEIPEEGLVWLRRQEGIRKVTYLSLR